MQDAKLKPHYHVEVTERDGVFVLAEGESLCLRGRVFEAVLPLLAQGHTVARVLELAGDCRVSPAEVMFAVEKLRARGLLCVPSIALARSHADYWHARGHDPDRVAQLLGATEVALVEIGEVETGSVVEALERSGLRIAEQAALALVITDDYLRPELDAFNQAALADGRAWLVARPSGPRAWLGPHFESGSACWLCLAQRLRDNRGVESLVRGLVGDPQRVWPARGLAPAPGRAFAELLVAQLIGSRVAAAALRNVLVEFDPSEVTLVRHPVVRRPQCPACGDPQALARAQHQPIRPGPALKRFTADGGHRQVTPEQTLDRLSVHVDPLTGVVPALTTIPSNRPQAAWIAPLVDAGHNPARPSPNVSWLRDNFRHRSMGKGASVGQARASGLCEAIERYCGVYRGDEARMQASMIELVELDHAAVDPRVWLGFSERQYRERESINQRAHNRVVEIPPRFDPAQTIGWTPAWSLRDDARRWLPTALCFYDHRQPGEPLYGYADSNGTAAGNSMEEAILQGFFELVERDAVAIWWHNRLSRPAVDLASFASAAINQLVEFYAAIGRQLWVLDITSDLGIPTFAAISIGSPGSTTACFGFGSHLDARIAVLRALTELNQFLPYLESYERGELAPDADVTGWLREASLIRDPHLAPSSDPPRHADTWPRTWHDDLRDDIRDCVDITTRAGLDFVVLDQTRPDIDLRVVRVIVPGLRHFWPRYGSGRLYEVPVALGWQREATPEDQLNPIHVFF
jgi:bacteriocin biosynthesis cyclodehydratase domain-containing protein